MNKLATAIATAALALGCTLAAPTSASAGTQVFSCRAWRPDGLTGSASCDFGLGGVYAWADCYTTYAYRQYGSTVPAGQVSSAVCRGSLYNNGYGTWSG